MKGQESDQCLAWKQHTPCALHPALSPLGLYLDASAAVMRSAGPVLCMQLACLLSHPLASNSFFILLSSFSFISVFFFYFFLFLLPILSTSLRVLHGISDERYQHISHFSETQNPMQPF